MNTDKQADIVVVDYATMTIEQLREAVGQSYQASDWKLMGKLSALLTKAETAVEAAKKTALQAELMAVTQSTRILLTGLIDLMSKDETPDQEIVKAIIQQVKAITGSELVGADGVWFAVDFGSIQEVGINPSCRLLRSKPKAATKSGNASDRADSVTYDVKTESMLAEVGSEVMFTETTQVTIDHIEQTMPAGTSYQQAYDKSTNGNWRHKVRMALLKKTNRV